MFNFLKKKKYDTSPKMVVGGTVFITTVYCYECYEERSLKRQQVICSPYELTKEQVAKLPFVKDFVSNAIAPSVEMDSLECELKTKKENISIWN